MSEKRADYFVDMPAGLDRAILRLLMFHVGRDNAIGRETMLVQLANVGFRVQDRIARAAINELRKTGQPICSAGGEGGGYWMAQNWEELTEYIERELHSRAMDMLEQEQALKKAAEQRWGCFNPALQARMVI